MPRCYEYLMMCEKPYPILVGVFDLASKSETTSKTPTRIGYITSKPESISVKYGFIKGY